MRILFASSELAPFAQTGGLGEAVRGLALALAARGHEVECLLPGYARALAHPDCPPLTPSGELRVALPGGALDGRCFSGALAQGVRVTFFDLPALYQRAGLYGYDDDPLRFLVFSRAAAYRAESASADVLVAHDWHAAMSIERAAVQRTNSTELPRLPVPERLPAGPVFPDAGAAEDHDCRAHGPRAQRFFRLGVFEQEANAAH
ncbi:MAG: glycogen/starch synthase [Myxococcota bacterium]